MVFVGREREASRIVSELTKGRNAVVSGPFGIGRTALIRHVAEEMGAGWRFAMLDFSHTPAELCSALVAALRGGGPRARGAPRSFVSARAAVLTFEPRGRRFVLVLDNVAAVTAPKLALLRRLAATGWYRFVAVVEPTLPDDELLELRACLFPSAVIVLSRLAAAATRSYFARLSEELGLGWSEEEIAGLAAISGGYPLVMVEAASRARARAARATG